MKSEALHECLHRLIPHIDAARIALTGGVAIGMHVDVSGGDQRHGFAADDVDFVTGDVGAVRQTVTNDFLVSHFHLPQPGYPKFLIQLVDSTSRLRLDFFPDTLRALGRAAVIDVAGFPLLVLNANDILDHKLALLSTASVTSPVEGKHYADAKSLGVMCGRDVPPVAASRLITTAYSQAADEQCLRCEASRCDAFPLAPKRAIIDILGYA